MKKIIALSIPIFSVGFAFSTPVFQRLPGDEWMPLHTDKIITLGWLAQYMEVIALVDILEHGDVFPGTKQEYYKVRVVDAALGCTNGQELAVKKKSFTSNYESNELFPVNSRIVVTASTVSPLMAYNSIVRGNPDPWDWNNPALPTIMATSETLLYNVRMPFWYKEKNFEHPARIYKGLPKSYTWSADDNGELYYTHLTNLVHAARIERNWTNFYYLCRDNVFSPEIYVALSSNWDLGLITQMGTHEQRVFMVRDPLFPEHHLVNFESSYGIKVERHKEEEKINLSDNATVSASASMDGHGETNRETVRNFSLVKKHPWPWFFTLFAVAGVCFIFFIPKNKKKWSNNMNYFLRTLNISSVIVTICVVGAIIVNFLNGNLDFTKISIQYERCKKTWEKLWPQKIKEEGTTLNPVTPDELAQRERVKILDEFVKRFENGTVPECDPRLARDQSWSMGRFAQTMEVAALAEIVEINNAHPKFISESFHELETTGKTTSEFPFGSFKVRVVNPIWGCTNGQEIVIKKNVTWPPVNVTFFPPGIIPRFSYVVSTVMNLQYSRDYIFPTNLTKRIVFAGRVSEWEQDPVYWGSTDWEKPPNPETIVFAGKNVMPDAYKRSWWYEDHEDGIPYAYFTNLARAARVERNWTNFYHTVRDSISNTASPMVWWDSHADMAGLIRNNTQEQRDHMENDPLFHEALRERVVFWKRPENPHYREEKGSP